MNKVLLLGNLGKDAERRTTQGGKVVATFGLGTSRVWKDQNGERKEDTQWHDIEHWSVSDRLFEYLKKGAKVLIEGELRYGEYEKNGVKHKTIKIVCSNLELANGSKSDKPMAPMDTSSLKMKDNVFAGPREEIPF